MAVLFIQREGAFLYVLADGARYGSFTDYDM